MKLRRRSEKDRVACALAQCFKIVLLLAERCNIDLPLSIQLKIRLNAKKYPVGIVKGSALKYDAYHATTGYGKGSKQVNKLTKVVVLVDVCAPRLTASADSRVPACGSHHCLFRLSIGDNGGRERRSTPVWVDRSTVERIRCGGSTS